MIYELNELVLITGHRDISFNEVGTVHRITKTTIDVKVGKGRIRKFALRTGRKWGFGESYFVPCLTPFTTHQAKRIMNAVELRDAERLLNSRRTPTETVELAKRLRELRAS